MTSLHLGIHHHPPALTPSPFSFSPSNHFPSPPLPPPPHPQQKQTHTHTHAFSLLLLTSSVLHAGWRGSQLCFSDPMDGHSAAVCHWARAPQSTGTAEVGAAPGSCQRQKAAFQRCRKSLRQEGFLVSQSSYLRLPTAGILLWFVCYHTVSFPCFRLLTVPRHLTPEAAW